MLQIYLGVVKNNIELVAIEVASTGIVIDPVHRQLHCSFQQLDLLILIQQISLCRSILQLLLS